MRFLLLLASFAAFPAAAQERPAAPAVPAVPAGPQQPAPTVMAEPAAVMIAAFDADGDARVTRAEFDAGLRRSFDSIDTARKRDRLYQLLRLVRALDGRPQHAA